MDTAKNISRLRAARLLVGKPLRVVADAAGVGIPHLSRIERGKRGPSPELVRRLAVVLDVRAGELFVEEVDE